jgi:hydrogenase-4 component B
MLAPMSCAAAGCVALGLAPQLVSPLVDRAVGEWAWEATGPALQPLASLAELGMISRLGWMFLGSAAVATIALKVLLARGTVASSVTWGCGYSAPTARMQYTSSSFAEMLGKLFAWVLGSPPRGPQIREIFPRGARFESLPADETHAELRVPAPQLLVRPVRWYRAGQEAGVQVYLVCMFIVLLALLVWR